MIKSNHFPIAGKEKPRHKACRPGRGGTKHKALYMAIHNESQAPRSFGAWRRLLLDQILRNAKLKPEARLVGFYIVRSLDRDSRTTFVSPSTIAQKLGLSLRIVRDSIVALKQSGNLDIRERKRLSAVFIPRLRDDATAPIAQPAGSHAKEFYKRRNQWLESVMLYTDLTPSDRIGAYAVAVHVNAATMQCTADYDTMSETVALSRSSQRRSVAKLRKAGLLDRDASLSLVLVASTLLASRKQSEGQGAQGGAQGGAQPERGSVYESMACADISAISVILSPKKERALLASLEVAPPLRDFDSSLWIAIHDIIIDQSRGREVKTIGGVIDILRSKLRWRRVAFRQLKPFIEAGWLERNGADLSVTVDGHHAVDRILTPRKAA
jgi:hypothetical protein